MITVGKLLEGKSPDVWSAGPEDSVYEAIEFMAKKGCGALCVTLNNDLIGIVSERDYARKIVLKGKRSYNTKVKEIMTRHVFHTVPDQNIEECLILMTEHRIRHLPVLVEKKLCGMISIGDVIKEIISDQKYTIKRLENYISWEESY